MWEVVQVPGSVGDKLVGGEAGTGMEALSGSGVGRTRSEMLLEEEVVEVGVHQWICLFWACTSSRWSKEGC